MRATTRLDGKVVVVTGAGRGLGAAYATHFAGLGARVLVGDIDADAVDAVARELTAAGGDVVAHHGSVSDPAVADSLVATSMDRWGRLDGFVNNAGLFHAATIDEEDPERVRALVEVNVLGAIYCGISALRQMLVQGYGSLVNVTSGTQSGAAGLSAYGASKGAVASLTYCWAMEVAGTGVRVNALSPNAQTRMATDFEEWQGVAARGQNIGKDPADNAPAAAYLISDASRRLNGQVLRVDGAALTVVSHPRPLEPAARREIWTAAEVAEAMDGELSSHVQPLGLAQATFER